jgi:hypothetical protein
MMASQSLAYDKKLLPEVREGAFLLPSYAAIRSYKSCSLVEKQTHDDLEYDVCGHAGAEENEAGFFLALKKTHDSETEQRCDN